MQLYNITMERIVLQRTRLNRVIVLVFSHYVSILTLRLVGYLKLEKVSLIDEERLFIH